MKFTSYCRLTLKKQVYCCSANQLTDLYVIENTVKLRVK